jgi:uncharacterized membrane protein
MGYRMVAIATVHSMLVELHSGMLTLAFICIIATVVARTHLRMRRTSESYGVFWPVDSFMGKIAMYAEPTSYVAGIGGVFGLIASAIIGFYAWPLELITATPLGLNKVLFSVLATELFIIFVLLRSKYGINLWKNGGTSAVYSSLAVFGFLFMVLAGSYGGHMMAKGSVLDPVYALLGITPETFGVTGFNFIILIISMSIVAIILPTALFLLLQRRAKHKLNIKT